MGADGGTIAKRSEIIPSIDKSEKSVNPEDRNAALWTQCALTGETLDDPVVSDWNGSIYNKTAILRYLLGQLPSSCKPNTQINQIRDVVEICREKSGDKWIDSLTHKELDVEGVSERFALIVECGHVCPFSILRTQSCCPICEQSYEDIVILNPRTTDSENNNRRRIEKLEHLGLSHNLRPTKRRPRKRNRLEDGKFEVKQKRIS